MTRGLWETLQAPALERPPALVAACACLAVLGVVALAAEATGNRALALAAGLLFAVAPLWTPASAGADWASPQDGASTAAHMFGLWAWARSVRTGSATWAALSAASLTGLSSASTGMGLASGGVPLHALIALQSKQPLGRLVAALTAFHVTTVVLMVAVPVDGSDPGVQALLRPAAFALHASFAAVHLAALLHRPGGECSHTSLGQPAATTRAALGRAASLVAEARAAVAVLVCSVAGGALAGSVGDSWPDAQAAWQTLEGAVAATARGGDWNAPALWAVGLRIALAAAPLLLLAAAGAVRLARQATGAALVPVAALGWAAGALGATGDRASGTVAGLACIVAAAGADAALWEAARWHSAGGGGAAASSDVPAASPRRRRARGRSAMEAVSSSTGSSSSCSTGSTAGTWCGIAPHRSRALVAVAVVVAAAAAQLVARPAAPARPGVASGSVAEQAADAAAVRAWLRANAPASAAVLSWQGRGAELAVAVCGTGMHTVPTATSTATATATSRAVAGVPSPATATAAAASGGPTGAPRAGDASLSLAAVALIGSERDASLAARAVGADLILARCGANGDVELLPAMAAAAARFLPNLTAVPASAWGPGGQPALGTALCRMCLHGHSELHPSARACLPRPGTESLARVRALRELPLEHLELAFASPLGLYRLYRPREPPNRQPTAEAPSSALEAKQRLLADEAVAAAARAVSESQARERLAEPARPRQAHERPRRYRAPKTGPEPSRAGEEEPVAGASAAILPGESVRRQNLQFLGCWASASQFEGKRDNKGPAGANVALASRRAFEQGLAFFAVARDGSKGYSYAFRQLRGRPLPGSEPGCSSPCLDEPAAACGCADGACPNGPLPGQAHSRRWAVYKLVDAPSS